MRLVWGAFIQRLASPAIEYDIGERDLLLFKDELMGTEQTS